MKKAIFLLLGLCTLISCKEFKKGFKDGYEAAKTNDEDKKPKIKLYVFDGGTVVANQLELFSQDTTYQGQSRQFADAFYVIKHPKGTLMWDAGLPENLISLPEPYTDPSGAFTVSRKDSLTNQLKSIGMSIDSIDFIALSHCHFDHIGHANQLKNATWLVQENEYDFVTNDSAKIQNADIYNSIKELTKTQKLNGDHDVFGDGTVIIKYAPGHTIGHQTLLVDIGLEKHILLTGDLYHFEENRENRGVPIFNYNVAQTLKSMDAFEAYAKEKNADVYIQHSQKDFDRLKQLLNN